ncbi:hypothetical protein YB2330_001247 [Saitoella coloradoensis]
MPRQLPAEIEAEILQTTRRALQRNPKKAPSPVKVHKEVNLLFPGSVSLRTVTSRIKQVVEAHGLAVGAGEEGRVRGRSETVDVGGRARKRTAPGSLSAPVFGDSMSICDSTVKLKTEEDAQMQGSDLDAVGHPEEQTPPDSPPPPTPADLLDENDILKAYNHILEQENQTLKNKLSDGIHETSYMTSQIPAITIADTCTECGRFKTALKREKAINVDLENEIGFLEEEIDRLREEVRCMIILPHLVPPPVLPARLGLGGIDPQKMLVIPSFITNQFLSR